MITVYNIRGTNGSGKTTLARPYSVPPEGEELAQSGPVDLHRYPSPTKRDPDRYATVEGFGIASANVTSVLVGSYRTACGGLDAVPDFDKTFKAIRSALRIVGSVGSPASERAVIAEGILASTVWGSWGTFAGELALSGQAQVAFCYLDTPLEVCLERIKKRQEAAGKVREIKEVLVREKVRAIAATRDKALAAGALVYDIPYQDASGAFRRILSDATVGPLITNRPDGTHIRARDHYRAS